jgi:hypothetical protein
MAGRALRRCARQKKTSASQGKTDASKQNEKPTLNKSFYTIANYILSRFVAVWVLIIS